MGIAEPGVGPGFDLSNRTQVARRASGRRASGLACRRSGRRGTAHRVYGCVFGVRHAAPGKPFPAVARRGELASPRLTIWRPGGWPVGAD